MYRKTWKVLAAFTVAIVIGFSGNASAEVDISKFNSAVSVELGKSADMNTLYQRADQIYEVVEHDDSHIIWKFTGTSGDYAFVFADGRLAVCSMAKFDLAAKDTLEKEVNDLIDLIDIIAGVTQDERDQAVDHAVYYASEAGVYQRIKYKYNSNTNLKLSVSDCTIKKARLNAKGFPNPGFYIYYFNYYIDAEQVASTSSGGSIHQDITSNIPSGVHDIYLKTTWTGFITLYIEAYTSPSAKKMVLYSDDYKTWIEDTTQSVTLDQLPGFISGEVPRDTDAKLSTTSTEPETAAEISTACVHLYGEKTDVVLGEDILLKLSAVNKITNPTMTLQVILIPPSGMSVTSVDFVESGAGLYTSTYVIEQGKGRNIEVGIRSNQVGDFVVNGEVIYYFEGEKAKSEDYTLSLPIKVRASPGLQQEDTSAPTATPKVNKGIPGFEAMLTAAGLLLVALLIKKRKVN